MANRSAKTTKPAVAPKSGATDKTKADPTKKNVPPWLDKKTKK